MVNSKPRVITGQIGIHLVMIQKYHVLIASNRRNVRAQVLAIAAVYAERDATQVTGGQVARGSRNMYRLM